MRITEKGQITIPVKLRKRYGLEHNVEVEFFADDNGIRIAKRGSTAANPFSALRGAAHKRMGRVNVDKYLESIRGR